MSQIPVFILIVFLTAPQTYLSAGNDDNDESNLLTKLDCQPGDKRVFDYESTTQLWGPLQENFLVRADVIVHCLGNDKNGKYGTNGLKYMVQIENVKPSVVKEKQNEISGRSRSKRGVGSWFKQAWVDVKDFFVNLFSRRNKKTDKDFDFDFEKQPSNLQYQCKGTKDGKNRAKRSAASSPPNSPTADNIIYDKMFSTPFVFIQLSNGSIPEIRFSDRDTDLSVKNFKRHIADTFATQLNPTKQRVLEQSPIGAHFSSYSYEDSDKVEESLQPTADGQSLKLSSSFLALSQLKGIKELAIMRDVEPDDVMAIGDGTGMAYDSSQIGVNAKQIQKISEGRLTTTAGHLSLSLVNPSKNLRTKRDVNENPEDIENYLKIRTKYSLSMTKRVKRSADEKEKLETLMEMESKLNLKGETIVSESNAENSLREKLTIYKKNINELLLDNKFKEQLVKHLSDSQNPIYILIMKAINLEVMLNEDQLQSSITRLINDNIKEKKISEVCGRKVSLKNKQCFDLMAILVKSQSRVALRKLISEFKSQNNDKNECLKLLVQTPNPQNWLIDELINIMKAQTTSNMEGVLLLAVSNLGYNSKSLEIKDKIADILRYKLHEMNCNSADEGPLLVDTLEAIGNLGHNSTIPYSERFGDLCLQSDSIRVAAIHSCRRLLSHPLVQRWFLKLIKEPTNSCVIKQEVVNALSDDISVMEMTGQSTNRWPKTDFNEIDNILSENLIQIKHNECFQENIIRYFERKSNDKSKAALKKAKRIRSKRAVFDSFWTESYCKEYVPQEGKKEMPNAGPTDGDVIISDRLRESDDSEPSVSYLKRRKCSATKTFGPNQAQAVFRTDIVNDASGSVDNPDYKLMAQFVTGTHFLGKDIDIGKMYVYHKKDSSRAYVNVFGNTLVDAATSDCNGTTVQPYLTSNYFPVYDFNLWIASISLGLRMTAEMDFDLPKFNCKDPTAQKLQIIQFKPEAKVRASGDVVGKVLVIRGGMNVGGDFNYFSNLEFDPSPQLCLSVANGYNPMNVSLSSWYQFYHPSCGEWMDKTVWSPLSLNWQIKDQHRSAWIENECLITSKDANSMRKRIDP